LPSKSGTVFPPKRVEIPRKTAARRRCRATPTPSRLPRPWGRFYETVSAETVSD
jgi:hypothetical protein